MKFIIAFVAVCVLGVCHGQINPAAFAAQAAQQIDADKTKWTPFQCRDGIYGPNDARMTEIGACATKNPSCTFFCQGRALGVLNSKGLPTQAIHEAWVEESFPVEHKAIATAWFTDCFQKYGKYIDLNDESCKMAKAFGDCTWEVQPHLTCSK